MPLPSPPYLIETPRFMLRLPQDIDLPDLYAIHSVDIVNRYLPYVTWTAMEDARAWLERARTRLQAQQGIQFVIVDKAREQVIGGAVVFGFDFDSGLAEIGYAIGQPYWGRGYMREILQGLIRFGFEALGLRRLEAQVDVRNTGSHHLLLAVGFEHEGMRRQNCTMKGEIKDSNVYGLLKNEWQGASPQTSAQEAT